MQDLFTGFLIVFAEVGAVLLLLFVFLLWRSIRKKSVSKKHVKKFMESYNEHKSENRSNVVSRLETGCNIERKAAEEMAQGISASERQLYKRVLNLVLGNEKNNLFEIQDDVNGLSEKWISAIKTGMQNAEQDGGSKMDTAHLSKQNEFLKNENARISDNYLHVRSRLQTAVELLENLVKEYSMLYSEGESNEIVEAIEEELNEMKQAMQEADDKASEETG